MTSKVTSQALLTGFNASGAVVFEQGLDLSDYWDESHPVIDESRFRQEKGIRKVVGRLYGSEGQLLQEFESTYDNKGTLETSHARHEDGTETTFPPR